MGVENSEQRAEWFNRGSDARIAGRRRDRHPHRDPKHWTSLYWLEGWDDVDQHWGEFSRKLGLPVTPLMEVK